jgi:hypothetical protein
MLRDAVPAYTKLGSWWSGTDKFIRVKQIKKQKDSYNCGPICIQYIACVLGEGKEMNLNNRDMLRSWITSELETAREKHMKIAKENTTRPKDPEGGDDESSDCCEIITPVPR